MPTSKISKEERILNLLSSLLNTHNPISHQRIHETINGYKELTHEASRRQLERDKSDLKNLGVQIKLKDVPGVDPIVPGYYINQDDYFLKDLDLTPEETAALNLLVGVFKAGNESLDKAVFKLGGIEDVGEAPNPLGMIWLDFNDELPQIQNAIKQQQVMMFEYQTELGENSTRQLEPLNIYLHDSQWHVRGYDQNRKAVRNFRLSRIQEKIKFQKTTTEFKARTSSFNQLMPWEYGPQDVEPQTAQLLISADNANWAAKQIGSRTKSTKQNDGSTLFEFNVTSPIHFYRFTASFNQDATVIGDEYLRNGFIQYLKELV